MMGAVRKLKNVEWEKNRRDKLNLTFSELYRLLPGHDPSLSLSKVQILRKTVEYILDLRGNNTRLLDTDCDSVFKKEMLELKSEVGELRRRNQQLLDLLRVAEGRGTVPPPPAPITTNLFSPPRKWRGRITKLPPEPEKKEEQKSKKRPNAKTKHSKSKRKTAKHPNIKTRSKTLSERNPDDSAPNNVAEVDKNSPTKLSMPLKEINNKGANLSNITTMFPRTITMPCTTMSLVLSNAKTSVVSVARSGLLATPIMATGIQPVLTRNLGFGSLGPGTLIMPDGRVVTVPPVLAAAPQIIVNRPPSQPAVILMQNVAAVKPTPHMRPIVPKPKPDSTRTTYVNKVPISAIRVGRVNSAIMRSKHRKETNKVPISAIRVGRVNSAIMRSKHRKETNKKTVNGKKIEEEITITKKPEKKAVLIELVKENQPESRKLKNQKSTKEKGDANKSKVGISHKPLQNPVSTNKKTLNITNSNSVKRKNLKVDKNIELVKRKKVDVKAVGVDNVSQADVVQAQSSVVDSHLQMTNNNKSTSQTMVCIKTSKETSFITGAKHKSNIETSGITSEKEIPANSDNQNMHMKEQEEKLQNIIATTNKNSVETNTEILVPVTSVAEFNKDVNRSNVQCVQKPSDVKVALDVHNLQTHGTVMEKKSINNTPTVTVKDGNNINKNLITSNKSTCTVDNNSVQRTSAVAENMTHNNIDNVVANNCIESNTILNNESTKRLMTQNCKATQITSEQLKYVEENTEITFESKTDKNLTTNKTDIVKKSSPDKTAIPDVTQDLTSLFPIDPKLQVCPDNIFRDTDFRDRNLFMPISHSYMEEVRLSLPHSDFSNDLFSSLQVPTGGQHPESISPTAAFLMAFPLVSTSKTSELIAENEGGESQHATPTTILQIGNIDPPNDLYQQTALMLENNVSDLHDPMKLNKSTSSSKNSNTKQMKRVEPFQQVQMNDLLQADNIQRNNCKEKKGFPALQEHNMYLSCNKKKSNGRTCEYPLTNEIITHFQEKPFEFHPPNASLNGVQNMPSHNRQVGVGNNQKKTQSRPDTMTDHQNCPASSQSYSYNAFPSGSDFSFPSSSYLANNQSAHPMPKPPQTLSNFTSSWSTSSVTATSNCVDYTSPYCSYPQKPYTNTPNNKSAPQKLQNNNYDDPRLKEKTLSVNTLPKFSTNFQFNGSHQPSLNTHVYPNTNQTDNGNYKVDSKTKKQKISNDSQRAPVNWMTTPDVRPVPPDSNIAPVLPDVLFPPQKELEFNSSANNIMFSTSNNITPFNISSTVANNSQTFYPNSHFSGMDFQLDFAPFPEITSTKSSKTVTTTSNNQFTWSPNKTSLSLLPHIDSHMIPSTLPTLVGDLALGTTTPSGPIDTFRNLNMPTTPFILDNSSKKFDSKLEMQKSVNKLSDKDCFPNAERRNGNKNIVENCQKTHSHQSTNTTSSFLSVSQLVDPVKSEQVTSRRSVKQTVVSATKTSAGVQKRNISHQTEKVNHSKNSSNISALNHSQNYHLNLPNPVMSNQYQRKSEVFNNNQTNTGYPNVFANNLNPVPWQSSKPSSRPSNFKGGSYSAESLIGEHQPQNPVPELPPFSVANQYSNNQKAFTNAPIVSSASYSGTDFSHQNMQPLDFQPTQHTNQNCFNFATHNAHYSEDYHNIGLDSLYSMNHPPHKTVQMDNKTGHKRNPPPKRREEMQYFPRDVASSRGTKCPSPSHHSTSSVTNFNLSTIFPEINDKRAVQGSSSYHSIGSKLNDNSSGRPSQRVVYTATNFNPQMQQVGQPVLPVSFTNVGQPVPPVSFANVGQPVPPVSFTNVGQPVPPVSFANVGQPVPPVSFASVGQSVPPVSFANVGQPVPPVSFANVGQPVPPVSFANVGQPVPPVSFANIGQPVPPVSFANVGQPVPPVSFANVGQPSTNFRPQ